MINDVIVVLIVIGLTWALVMFVQSVIALVHEFHEFIVYRREQKQQEVER